MKYGLIGEHLGHSYSKEIHAILGNPEYELTELAPDELGPFLERHDFLGINVTIPYKEQVIPYLDTLSDRAAAIGAVNTIVCRNGKLIGDNTDYAGMKALLERIGIRTSPKGKALVLGTGGTSKTARAVLKDFGFGEILTVSRREGRGSITYEQAAHDHSDADLILNATPCGMFPHEEGISVDPRCFPDLSGIMDAVYHPLRTNLVLEGLKRGIRSEGGLYMLVAQAVYAHSLFMDKPADPGQMEEIYHRIRMQKQNLVLVGMPSSGKTTVGTILSGRTGKPLVDTDGLIAERAGMQAGEYIRAYGEPAFRDLESDVIRDCARMEGVILSTGGGAVLREGNRTALQRNGRVIFLDRPLDQLACTEDRPLSSDREKLTRLYSERMPVYRTASDCTIKADAEPETVADRVWEAFQQ